MTCSCGRIKLGSKTTDLRDWRPTCVDHGVESVWYNSDEQKTKRAADSRRLRELQLRAAEARRGAKR